MRTALTAVVIGIAASTAALVFTASFNNLIRTPKLYGARWDALVSANENEGSPPTAPVPTLRADPAVAAVAVGYSGVPLTLDGATVGGLALPSGPASSLGPTITAGRPATAPGEVVLGTRDLRRLHLRLGDRAHLACPG